MGLRRFLAYFFADKEVGPAAGDVALTKLLFETNLLKQICYWKMCKEFPYQASFFIFLVENEAKNKNEQTKAYPQAVLPAFVHPFTQENQAIGRIKETLKRVDL